MNQFLLDELKNYLKNNKLLLVAFSFFYLLYLMNVNFPVPFEVFTNNLRDIIVYCMENYISLIFFLLNLLFIYTLLKKSDYEYKKSEKEHYPDFRSYTSKEVYPILTKIYFCDRDIDNSFVVERKIEIYNKLDENLENVEGVIEFYNNRVLVNSEKFHVDCLEAYRGVRIIDDIVDSKKEDWNEFRTKIINAKSMNKEYINHVIIGDSFHMTYFHILNKLHYIRLGKFKISYEISWLKEKIKSEIIPWYKWYFGINAFRKKSIVSFVRALLVNIALVLYIIALLNGGLKLLYLGWLGVETIVSTILSIYRATPTNTLFTGGEGGHVLKE